MRRKILLTLFSAIAFISFTNAQIKKGSVLVGGSINYSQHEREFEFAQMDQTIRLLTISPAVGFATRDNVIVGGDILYGSNTETDQNSGNKTRRTTLGAGVFARKYWQLVDRLYLFGQGRAGFSYGKEEEEQPNQPNSDIAKSHTIGLTLYPGISFAIKKNFHLEAGLADILWVKYSQTKNAEGSSNYKSSDFYIGSGLSSQIALTVGIRFIL